MERTSNMEGCSTHAQQKYPHNHVVRVHTLRTAQEHACDPIAVDKYSRHFLGYDTTVRLMYPSPWTLTVFLLYPSP